MRVLVTGAAGFVGARLVEILLDGGYRVLGLDVLDGEDPPGWQAARLDAVRDHQRFDFVRADVTDERALQRSFAEFAPWAVVHLASRRDLQLCEADPAEAMRLHVEGAIQVMRASRRADVAHLLLATSAHVYGGSRRFPFTESDPADRPLSVLGAAMRSVELTAHAFALRTPVNTAVVRLFSVYGPRQSPGRLVPAMMAAAERRAPLPIFGDGTAGRDMLYVDDAVVGLLRVLDRPAPWRVLNLGSGETTTVGQVAERISTLADVVQRWDQQPARPGEMDNTWADITAIGQLGYQPAVELDDGLRRTWSWWRERPGVFRNSAEREP